MKKGQVTVFIIIGLLILLVVGFFFLGFQQEIIVEEVAVSPLEAYVTQCIQDVGRNAIDFVSSQGGYYEPVDPLVPFGMLKIPYYLHEDETHVVSLETIEQEVGHYTDVALERCVGEFSSFVEQGYSIDAGVPTTSVEIVEGRATFTVGYPLTATLNGAVTSAAEFRVEIETPLFSARQLAEEIIEAHDDDTEIPLTVVGLLGEAYEFDVDMGHYNGTVLYSLNRFDSGSGEGYIFTFAGLYDWGGANE